MSTDALPDSGARPAGACPIDHTDYRVERPALWHADRLDQGREDAPLWWNDSTPQGFWMVTRYDQVVEALRMPEVFSNRHVSAFDQSAELRLLPQMLDGEEHARLRRVINPFFSPRAVKRLEPLAQERARALVDEVREQGGCDYVTGFGLRYPTDLFLALLGLPTSDGATFVPWVEGIFAGFFGDDDESQRRSAEAATNIMAYFGEAVDDRARNPRDPDEDLVTRLVLAEVDGVPLPRQDILTICLTLMAAGLDTTRSALGFVHFHLAQHPELRARLTADPSLWPKAVEETIRLYGLVFADGRQVARDVDFHGAPMKAGDAVWLGLTSASRDPRKFADPTGFDLERPDLTHHLGFGAGPHRCVGMHLARSEMVIALQTWHDHIPDYEIAPGSPLRERGGQVSLTTLPLRWEAP
jgi:cytochrome P450